MVGTIAMAVHINGGQEDGLDLIVTELKRWLMRSDENLTRTQRHLGILLVTQCGQLTKNVGKVIGQARLFAAQVVL